MMKCGIKTWSTIKHPYCSCLRGIINQTNSITIISDYFPNGSLERALEKCHEGTPPREFTSTKKTCSLYGICSIMSYVHSLNIIHRDLKPDSIYLNSDFEVVVANFKFSRPDDIKINPNSTSHFEPNIGSSLFIAPEVLALNPKTEEVRYSREADVFSFGVIFYVYFFPFRKFGSRFMPCLQNPNGEVYPVNDQFHLYTSRKKGAILKKQDNIPDDIWNDIIIKCFSLNPSNRPTFAELASKIESDRKYWFDNTNEKEFYDYVHKMKNLIKNP